MLSGVMQTFWQDLSLAARLLRKNPGFTAAAVLTLALGIGANATIFSFADAMLLRTLPVRDAERLVHVYQHRPGSNNAFPLSYADYVDYRAQAQLVRSIGRALSHSPMHLVVDGDPQAVNGAVVTATYFDLLQLQPAHGPLLPARGGSCARSRRASPSSVTGCGSVAWAARPAPSDARSASTIRCSRSSELRHRASPASTTAAS